MQTEYILQLASILLLIAITIFYVFTKDLPFFKLHLWIFALVLFFCGIALLAAFNMFTYKLLVEKGYVIVICLLSLLIIPAVTVLSLYNISDIKVFLKKLKD